MVFYLEFNLMNPNMDILFLKETSDEKFIYQIFETQDSVIQYKGKFRFDVFTHGRAAEPRPER